MTFLIQNQRLLTISNHTNEYIIPQMERYLEKILQIRYLNSFSLVYLLFQIITFH